MRETTRRAAGMPFRVWYEEAEIEAIIEGELARSGLGPPDDDLPAVDVDAFLERHLGCVPQYVALPPGVLGATQFGRDGSVEVRVNGILSVRAEGDGGAETLLRSTLAHEAAHVLLHRSLFLRESETIFAGHTVRTELCRAISDTAGGYSGDWWEWQANRGMQALLMPSGAMHRRARRWRAAHGAREVGELSSALAADFRVSARAARLRLARLGIAPMRSAR